MRIKYNPESYRFLQEGAVVLSRMKANGIKIDTDYLEESNDIVGMEIDKKLKKIKKHKYYKMLAKKFKEPNLFSTLQMRWLIYDKLKHSFVKKTGKGVESVDDEVLNSLENPFFDEFLSIKKLEKIRGTYLKGIEKYVTTRGFLHATFALNTTLSFRSSSLDPNLQNVPIRTALGEYIRRCFIPRPGRVLVESDYGGIEVSIAACYHKDPRMLDYLRNNKDMHQDMAMDCFQLKRKQVHKMIRYAAKNMFVFPQFYGSYWKQCAPNLWKAIHKLKLQTEQGVPLLKHLRKKGITELGTVEDFQPSSGSFYEHIKQVEDDFWGNRFGVYGQWKIDHWQQYLRKGYIKSKTGFTIHGPFRKNQVINLPVQGSAFHCLLKVCIEMQKRIDKENKKSLLVSEIHDSIIGDVPEEEFDWYKSTLKEIMLDVIPNNWKWIIVPLKAELDVAKTNWFEKKSVPF